MKRKLMYADSVKKSYINKPKQIPKSMGEGSPTTSIKLFLGKGSGS